MADATHYLDDIEEPAFQLTAGTMLSGAAHLGLLGWLFVGWGLQQEPLEFETVDVSVVSTQEFAALVNRGQPQVALDEPAAPVVPSVQSEVPQVTPEDPIEIAQPEIAPEVPVDEIPPEALEPIPQVEPIEDDVPVLDAPAVPVAPDLPVVTDTPQVDEAPRIAPDIAEAPPLEADVAPEVQQAATPESESAEVVEEPQEAAAPEEATTEIVTEAEVPSGAVEVALRPPSRPERVQPVAEPEVEEPVEPPVPAEDTTVEDLLSELTAEPVETPAAEVGPPLTGGERDAFRLAVQGCWNPDTGSEAARVEVTVAFSLDRDGFVIGDRVQLVANTDGTETAVRSAFEAARRAILRCQSGGYDLPDEKYEQWRDVEMTFNPENMRIR